ncbi:hypothetical protein pkur_cds_339 [Pandoravirus kuranda]|uniref:Uncharacterized protein n=1 Tax=Pandoravirus kuranda TaxID=3019033 RepID=A0AA95EIB7_9VIRU|nr:hypothetical protein pkur_cds_339 [Pandoravirus kuranda]
MALEREPPRQKSNGGRWAMVATATGLFCLGLILVGAQPPRAGMCRVVARRVVAEKTDDADRRSYLAAVAVVPISNDDGHGASFGLYNNGIGIDIDVDDDDDDNEVQRPTAHVSASWVDATELGALWHRWRPGTEVPCTHGKGAISILATPDTPRTERSDAGEGPRIAALCAAAAALALVLGCGIVACACKTTWCIQHCRPRRAAHTHGSLWGGDDDARHGHRLVDSVFG